MARILLTLLGLIFTALGVLACIVWWGAIKMVLLALVALVILLVGLVLLIFGISELAGARPPQK